MRDKRYIANLSNATLDARRLNESRPWHDAGYIDKLRLPILQTHCEALDSNVTRHAFPMYLRVKPVKGSKSFRLKLNGPERFAIRTDNCPICITMDLSSDRDKSDVPMFFHTIQKEIIKEFTAQDDILLIPHKMYFLGKDEGLEDTAENNENENIIGFLVIALSTKHKGGNLVVCNGNTKEEFDLAARSSDSSTIQWAAFRSDCRYQVTPVREGYSTLLIYSIHRVPIKINESKICAACKPLPPKKQTMFETRFKNDVGDAVKKFTRELKKSVRRGKEKKLGLFMQNRYPMSFVRPAMLKGVDRQIYDEMKDFDVTLTPVLCYIGGAVIDNPLLGAQTTLFGEKIAYSFTMDDLSMLKDMKRREKQPDEEIEFWGFDTDTEVILNQGVSEGIGLPFFGPKRMIRWSYHSAMIISAPGKKNGKCDDTRRQRGSSKTRSKRKVRAQSGQRNKKEQTKEQTEGNSAQVTDDKEASEEGATVVSESEEATTDTEEFEECRACGTTSDELGEPLRMCSQCHEAKYCSRQCERAHWKAEHKYTCGKYAMELD